MVSTVPNQGGAGATTSLPHFSVIVPSFDRPADLVRCLESLTRLDYPRDRFDVVVAIDGTGKPPDPVLERLRQALDLTVCVLPHAGPAAARNAAVERATGQFLAFTDDDCTPAADWLRKLAARFAASAGCLIGGRTVNVLPNRYAAASQLLTEFLYSCYNPDHGRARLVASNNLAVSAEAFRAVGGFDTAYARAGGEDRDLCERWLRLGCSIQFAPEAVVYHAHPMSFASFWRQHFNYGRGSCLYYRRRSWLRDGLLGCGRLSFYVSLLRYPLSRKEPANRASNTALFVASQGATAAGFLWERLAHLNHGH